MPRYLITVCIGWTEDADDEHDAVRAGYDRWHNDDFTAGCTVGVQAELVREESEK